MVRDEVAEKTISSLVLSKKRFSIEDGGKPLARRSYSRKTTRKGRRQLSRSTRGVSRASHKKQGRPTATLYTTPFQDSRGLLEADRLVEEGTAEARPFVGAKS